MKIGVITFWDSRSNYGQLLQCWALQQVLIGMGHDPYLIRYVQMPDKARKFRMFQQEGFVRSVIYRISHNRQINLNKKLKKENALHDQVRDFQGFLSDNIRLSEQVYDDILMLRTIPPQADVYLTGSDQVWSRNPAEDVDRAFFLDFGGDEVIRMSYAASFGSRICDAARLDAMKPLLARFKAISVRETSGCDICAAAGFPSAMVTLDPTLLLSQEHYLSIADKSISESPYMMLYSINIESTDQMDWDSVKEFARQKGCEVRSVSSTGHIPGRNDFEGSVAEYPTIPRWLGLIRNSEMVFTTSFHGVVFSILFHRNFVFYPLDGRYSPGNERVTDLLKRLQLEDHIWNRNMDYNDVCIPDWQRVDAIFEIMRSESYYYLKTNLQEP